VHRLAEGRPLVLGGVRIPHERGLLGHSDADAVLHAITDAVLGALGDGDIGQHFPDSDARYRGVSSADLLRDVVGRMRQRGYAVVNVDVTITAEAPRIGPYRDAIRSEIARLLEIAPEQANVKAKSNEGLDAIGHGDAIAATAVVLLVLSGAPAGSAGR